MLLSLLNFDIIKSINFDAKNLSSQLVSEPSYEFIAKYVKVQLCRYQKLIQRNLLFFSNENKSSALTPRLILFAEHQKPEVVRPNVFQQAAEDPFYNFPTISVWRIPPPSVTTPEMTSKLPELRKSPDYQVSSDESNYEAIEPPKRRKLQSSDESLYLKSSMKTIQRPASTSCTWTPWIRYVLS